MSFPQFFYPQAAEGGSIDAKIAKDAFANPDFVAQEKLDGARYLIHKGLDGVVRIYSRHISTTNGQPVDKTIQLHHLATEFNKRMPKGTVIDGEVIAPGGKSSSNLVTRVTGSKPDRAVQIQEREGYLEYHAFDMLAVGGVLIGNKPYEERYVSLTETEIDLEPHFDILTYVWGNAECTSEVKREFYNEIVARGGEGIILKDKRAPYHQGERDRSWVKVKTQRTFDVIFTGIELANETSVKKGGDEATRTRIAGQAGAIKYGQYVVKDGYTKPRQDTRGQMLALQVPSSRDLLTLGTVSGFDDAMRADITANWQVYTRQKRVFEVTAQEQFKTGALRHPRFLRWRDDKNAADCVFRQNEG